jgi:hypothetical protein
VPGGSAAMTPWAGEGKSIRGSPSPLFTSE